MKTRAVILLSFLVAAAALGDEPLPVNHERAIVVLQRNVRNAAADVVAEAKRLGVTVEATLGDRLIVSASPAILEQLRAAAAVRYVQRVGVEEASAGANDAGRRTMVLMDMPVQTHSTQSWKSGDYVYDGAGNVVSIGSSAAPGTQGYRTYGYDSVTRLTKAGVAGVTAAATYEYTYDVYGNRTASGVNSQWTNVPVSAANNRLTDATYDVRGNQLSRGVTAATFDGFDMATSYRFDGVNVETYVYTASDERIGVRRGNDWTWSVRGSDGKVLRQFRSSATSPSAAWLWLEDFVYRDGLLLGAERMAEEGGRRHYHLDHLGSPRLVTSLTGAVLSEHDFLPFGEERTPIAQHLARGFDREEPFRFTGHERDFDNLQPNDSSSYVDYMHARYYTATTGRFLSVDPVLDSVSLFVPQSWNRYSYALNNPINITDPKGLEPCKMTLPDGTETEGECIEVEAEADVEEIDWVSLSAGFGDGIIGALTLGLVSGHDLRTLTGADQVVDRCSGEYLGGRVAGTATTIAVYAYGAIPATLTHVTTRASAAGIEAVGTVFPSTATYMGGVATTGGGVVLPSTGATLLGNGVYATAGSGALVPGASSISLTVSSQGFFRVGMNAAFLNGGSAQTAAMAGAWAGTANAEAVVHKALDCK